MAHSTSSEHSGSVSTTTMSSGCANCAGEPANYELGEGPLCKECFHTAVYRVDPDTGPLIPTVEQVVTDESPIRPEDFLSVRKESSSRFRMSFAEVADIAGFERDTVVHIEFDGDSDPSMFVLDEVPEAELDSPMTRRVDARGGARVTIPPRYFEPETGIGIDTSAYSNENRLLLWPQVFDGALFLFVFGFESEIEDARDQLTSHQPDPETEPEQSTEQPSESPSTDATTTSDTTQQTLSTLAATGPDTIPSEPVAQITPASMRAAVKNTPVGPNRLVPALKQVATLDPTHIKPYLENGTEDVGDATIYTVETDLWDSTNSLWNQTELDTLPDDVLEACRHAHDVEAYKRSEETPGYETYRMVSDAVVLPN